MLQVDEKESKTSGKSPRKVQVEEVQSVDDTKQPTRRFKEIPADRQHLFRGFEELLVEVGTHHITQ